MKHLLINSAMPFALFVGALSLLGCDQISAPASHTEAPDPSTTQSSDAQTHIERSSGNMLYIVRDVADLQLKAGEHLSQLQKTQDAFQSAVDSQNTEQLQNLAQQLQQQLTSFNTALDSLNLKSQEIEQIRQSIQQANDQVLASKMLNGQIDLAQIDIKQIEQQMGNVQNEMLKLGSMLLTDSVQNLQDDQEDQSKSES